DDRQSHRDRRSHPHSGSAPTDAAGRSAHHRPRRGPPHRPPQHPQPAGLRPGDGPGRHVPAHLPLRVRRRHHHQRDPLRRLPGPGVRRHWRALRRHDVVDRRGRGPQGGLLRPPPIPARAPHRHRLRPRRGRHHPGDDRLDGDDGGRLRHGVPDVGPPRQSPAGGCAVRVRRVRLHVDVRAARHHGRQPPGGPGHRHPGVPVDLRVERFRARRVHARMDAGLRQQPTPHHDRQRHPGVHLGRRRRGTGAGPPRQLLRRPLAVLVRPLHRRVRTAGRPALPAGL
ncbi:MAG: Efflux ABC transporter, permease protein, partial [uncultured Acidimicrobiales bacterium]